MSAASFAARSPSTICSNSENAHIYERFRCAKASQTGFEPAATRLGGGSSIQLRYWDIFEKQQNWAIGQSDA